MTKRFWFLLSVVLITIIYWSLENYQNFIANRTDLGVFPTFENGHFEVDSIMERTWSDEPSAVARGGLQKGDQIVAVYNNRGAGGEISGYFDFASVLATIRRDEPWTVVILRKESGQTRERHLTIPKGSERTLQERLLRLGLSLLLPLICISTAFFISFMRPDDNKALLASLFFLSLSTLVRSDPFAFPYLFREVALLYHITLNSFLLYLFLLFFLRFPSPSSLDRKAPWLKKVFLVLAFLVWILNLIGSILLARSFDLFHQFNQSLGIFTIPLSVMYLLMLPLGFLSLVLNTIQAKTRDERRRMVTLLLGASFGLLPVVALIVYVHTAGSLPPFWAYVGVGVSVGIFPVSFVYVVIRYRVLGIRLILRRGLQYALVSRGFLLGEAVFIFVILFFVTGPLLVSLVPDAGSSGVAAGTAVMALGAVAFLQRVNRRVMPVIDRRFFRDAYNVQQVLTELSHAVRQMAAQPDRLLETVTEKIDGSFHPQHVAVFLNEPIVLPPGTSGQQASGSRKPSGYLCYALRRRADVTTETELDPDRWENLGLPAESVLGRHLEALAIREPEVLEIYPGDPKSWDKMLAKLKLAGSWQEREKSLFQELNTQLIVPLITQNRALGFISLGEKLSEEPYSKEDQELLLTVAGQIAIALDYAKLIGQVASQEKIRQEMRIAKEVQSQLFPTTLPSLRTLDYTGVCRAAGEVGGDYYDFLPIDDHQLYIAVGDTAGKGMSAALLMASLQASLRSHAPLHRESVNELVADVNRLLCSSTDSTKYATFFCGVYDDLHRKLTYVNAGHNPPILFRATRERVRLETGGTVVGPFSRDDFSTGNPPSPAGRCPANLYGWGHRGQEPG